MRYMLCLTTLCAIGWPIVTSGQTNALFGGRGTSAQGGLGNTSSLGSTGMSGGRSSGTGQSGSLFGNTGFGSSSMNSVSSGFGNSSMSGSGMNSGLGGQQGFTLSNPSLSVGTGPFVGASDNRGRQVGNRFAGQQGAMGAIQALQGLQGLQRDGGFNGNRSGGDDNERLPIRPTQRIAFDFTPATSTAAVERVTTKFAGIVERRPQLAGVTFATDNEGNVILRGTVESKEAAQLAAALVRLEPGVRGVVNELDVTSGTTP